MTNYGAHKRYYGASGFGVKSGANGAGNWTLRDAICAIRTRFAKIAEGLMAPPRAKTALRNHALMNLEREARILDEVLADVQKGGIVAGCK